MNAEPLPDISGLLRAADGRLVLGEFTAPPSSIASVGSFGRFLPSGQLDPAFGAPAGSGVGPANASTIAASL